MARISIAATGDSVLLTRLPGGYDGFEPVSRFIRTADARITNLETVISNFEHFPSAFSGGTWINAEPDKLYELLSFGFNMVGWANNHTLDYSYGGLFSTKRELDKSGVAHAGAGMDLDEASRPAVLDLPNARLGMISICSTFNDAARAGEKSSAARPADLTRCVSRRNTASRKSMRALMEIAETTRLNGGNDALRRDGFCRAARRRVLFRQHSVKSRSARAKGNARQQNRYGANLKNNPDALTLRTMWLSSRIRTR